MESNLKHDEEQINTTIAYREKIRTRDIRLNLISFALMITLTGIAFFAVGTDFIPKSFALPFIVVLATIQVFMQFAYFMHMNQKGHEFPIFFILSAAFAVILTVAGCAYLIWLPFWPLG